MNLVYAALTISPAWSRTVLVINYDEWGGFFDHVPPNELSRFSDSLRSDGESLGLRRFTEASVLHRQSVAGGPIVSKLDAVANPEAGNAVDSEGIVARVLSEVMPAGFHIDDACASVEDAYALLRRFAHAKAPHDPIAAGPGCSDG